MLAGVPIDQALSPNLPLSISWTGDTVFGDPPGVAPACRDVAQAYTSMSVPAFFKALVTLIFRPLAS